MGLPVTKMIAANNSNDVFTMYHETGNFEPKHSVQTLSNAMDVGNPSNFERMLDLYCSTWNNVKEDIKGYTFSDAQTEACMQDVFNKHGYIIDPHGAVGYLALQEYQRQNIGTKGVILETAHPSKFLSDVERILNQKIEVPERLANLSEKEKNAEEMGVEFLPFKEWLLRSY